MSLPSPDGASPAMAQWFTLKAAHPDALLLFRMGDFYELFFADAEAAAAALDIALTTRGQHGGGPIPMCGVPVAAASAYVSRLIRRGFRLAVAEQTEKPRLGQKGPLARAVVRLITAGTLTEDDLLEAGRPNLLLALAVAPNTRPTGARPWLGAAWIDISTGLFETASIERAALGELLGRLDPAEILASPDIALHDHETRRAPPASPPPPLAARSRLAEAFGAASLDAFGSFSDAEAMAAALALDYVRRTQAGSMPRLSRPAPQADRATLGMDPATRASLDLLRARDGGQAHTLLAAVDQTLTAPGRRMLVGWIAAPLTDPAGIARRQQGWAWLAAEAEVVTRLRAALRGVPDIARALGRLSLGRGQPRDLAALRDGLFGAHEALVALDGPDRPAGVARIAGALDQGGDLRELLTRSLAADLPSRLEDGGAIAAGHDGELDAERALRDDSRRVIAGLQNDYAQRYGVASLKIRHHSQLGYVIEVPASAAGILSAQAASPRDGLALRQGTASLVRYSTDELSALDRRIAEAAERAALRECTLFDGLVRQALDEAALPPIADALALLDVLQSAARLAAVGDWCRAQVTDDDAFRLQGCRHPVVQAALPRSQRFTPNDCDLSPACRTMLLTGPNMAGKSTFLRQTALAVILAQAGLPVPAARAELGVVDRLFSRVGASDDLAHGRSTFMVEMIETAAILNLAGPRSLVVVDEIGRGTATLDGLAIAWAVLEALHSGTRCRTIFATHFHELAQLAESLPRLAPHTMSVREWKGQVVFQHEVVRGAARRSWGVHVARLAGVPEAVVGRAARLLADLEREHSRRAAPLPLFATTGASPEPPGPERMPPDASAAQRAMHLSAALVAIDPDSLTPREALEALYRLRAQATQSDPVHAALHDDPVARSETALEQ
nr:DNA mismatch repair protein MutS [uncultured Lichenicoccus sp.]